MQSCLEQVFRVSSHSLLTASLRLLLLWVVVCGFSFSKLLLFCSYQVLSVLDCLHWSLTITAQLLSSALEVERKEKE